MNILISNPNAGQLVARQIIDERVRDAEQRRVARSARAQRHHDQHPKAPGSTTTVPWWSFRFLRPAH